jgi:hypothetical protein
LISLGDLYPDGEWTARLVTFFHASIASFGKTRAHEAITTPPTRCLSLSG